MISLETILTSNNTTLPSKYVQSVCNAAIHGQKVSYGQAAEALQLGIVIINKLKEIE